MNKKGFTLTELLAVIVIIAVISLIGTISLGAVRNKIDKNMFANKLELVRDTAKLWGGDNKSELPITKSVDFLITSNYLATDEVDSNNKKSINDPVTGLSINNAQVNIYVDYNRVYACIKYDTLDISIQNEYIERFNEDKFNGVFC